MSAASITLDDGPFFAPTPAPLPAPGSTVTVLANDAHVPPGTVATFVGLHPDSGNPLVVLPDGRRVALTADQLARPTRRTADPARLRAITCAIPGCGKPASARGWCPMHYKRWRVTGDPLTTRPRGRPKGRRSMPEAELRLRNRLAALATAGADPAALRRVVDAIAALGAEG